jgi:hypothetical protein
MPMSPEEVLRAELSPGESLLWGGRASRPAGLSGLAGYSIWFNAAWLVVSTGGAHSLAGKARAFVFVFYAAPLPFTVCLILCSFRRTVFGPWLRARTVYGVTSARVIRVELLHERRVRSWGLATLTGLTVFERDEGGAGTIGRGVVPKLGQVSLSEVWNGAPFSSVEVIMDLPEGARKVFQIIRSAARALNQRQAPLRRMSDELTHPDETVEQADARPSGITVRGPIREGVAGAEPARPW